MKKMIMIWALTLLSVCAMAQEVLPKETAETVIDVTTFGGMMAVVTAIVTQFAKLIPYINEHKWAKVLTSLGVGVAATMACWGLQVSDYLTGLIWWQALIAGVAVGLSAAGFFDLVKAVWSIFKPKEDDDVITYNGKK